jgi:hypothetical protein
MSDEQKIGFFDFLFTQWDKKNKKTVIRNCDWTKINKTPNEYYFMFDTRDKIPNEYYIDLKVTSSGEINTYKKQIKFQIVNLKYLE